MGESEKPPDAKDGDEGNGKKRNDAERQSTLSGLFGLLMSRSMFGAEQHGDPGQLQSTDVLGEKVRLVEASGSGVILRGTSDLGLCTPRAYTDPPAAMGNG